MPIQIDKPMYAAVDSNGEVWGNPESEAMGEKEEVKFIVDSWAPLKQAIKKGEVKVIKVKLVKVEE